MSFAAPWALAGLALAAIPILLHLLARREPPTVLFPATRYLTQTAREHQRRLRLQHLLLLLVRTLLVILIVLAAAGPSWPTGSVGTHAPTALVVVLDNSLSSGAVRAGVPVLEQLKEAGRAVLRAATLDDRLWLVAADGIPRSGTAAELGRVVDALGLDFRRLDLAAGVGLASRIAASADRPGAVLVITDLQRTAVGSGEIPPATTVVRPGGPSVPNAGVAQLTAGVQPWGPEGSPIGLQLAGNAEGSRPVTVAFVGRASRQLLVPVGGQGTVRVAPPGPGWWALEAALDPDELRADDRRVAAVRVAPPARVAWESGDRYLATAAEVLAQNGRVVAGEGVALGALGRGAAVVLPPADPAAVGAVNRALSARGSRWRFGDLDLGVTMTDSGPWIGRARVTRRYRLVFAGGAPAEVLATAGGEPWLVRSGSIVLVGSRLDPDWTALPLAAGFVPFVDALVNRAARGELVALSAAPGDPVVLPDRVTTVAIGSSLTPVEGGAPFRPSELGVHYLLADGDTVGALTVNPDPRESDLEPATDAELRSVWPGVRISNLDAAGSVAFATGARRDLRGPLLWVVAVLLLGEAGLASARRGGR